ncbi:hypothetical protein Cgig2_026810 [Carnegiea gigantea]|uniref:Uncharacterized protein n=1 Tax=Carnegiea gigantea TaxID=171969 RepID=A0A9Q1JZC4_9CARY|nr:hypothetical protein Cgig2_026810 [Carnegiea gigantea]
MILDNGSYVEDDSSAHIEDTKLCIEGDNSSSRSSMRVKEIDNMEELSMEACSSISSNMEFEEHNTNPKSVPPDMTYVKSQDYCMMSTPISNSKFATRNVMYKPIGITTRRRSLKLLCLLEATYQRIEQGGSIEFFDKNKSSYMVIRIHRSDHQNQRSNIMDGVNQEHYTPIAFLFSAQENKEHKKQKQCWRIAAILASESSIGDAMEIINSIKTLILKVYVAPRLHCNALFEAKA